MPFRRLVIVVALSCLAIAVPSVAQQPDGSSVAKELRDAEAFAAGVEAAQMEAGNVGDPKKLAGQAKKHLKSVRKHLSKTPDDAYALVLLARVGWIFESLEPPSLQGGSDGWTVTGSAEIDFQATLDRAIELNPELASAHYWKARVYGTRRLALVDGAPRYAYDYDQAAAHAGHAVELEPTNAWYRDALAQYLAFTGAYDDAAEAMTGFEEGRPLLSDLIQDMRALPLPPMRVRDDVVPNDLADRAVERAEARGYDLPNARVRYASWVVRGSLDDIERFYREHWPDFRTVPDDEGALHFGFLLATGEGLRPDPEVEARDFAFLQQDGLFLLLDPVSEERAGQADMAALVAKLPGEGPVTRMLVTNGRGLPWASR